MGVANKSRRSQEKGACSLKIGVVKGQSCWKGKLLTERKKTAYSSKGTRLMGVAGG